MAYLRYIKSLALNQRRITYIGTFALGAFFMFVVSNLLTSSREYISVLRSPSDVRVSTTKTQEPTRKDLFDGSASWNDDQLLRHIRSKFTPPSPRNLLNLSAEAAGRRHFSQFEESEVIDKHLNERTNGFFIECGAFDGVTFSNSLFFERHRNWTGLLIEANPQLHETLLERRRHAYVLSACLSPRLSPGKMMFIPGGPVGGLADKMAQNHKKLFVGYMRKEVTVECYPLMSIMAALGISHVDYFSLDIEGAELEVLETIDWNSLRIDILNVEYNVADEESPSQEKLDRLRALFAKTNLYREVTTLRKMDVVFERI